MVGAGLGRTGTVSLKLALEQLLGAPCYHMMEVFARLEADPPVWTAAMQGRPTDWATFLDGYAAIVDWPGAACWQEMADAFPDAIVLLSTRTDAEAWYRSAADTIFIAGEHEKQDPKGPMVAWVEMIDAMQERHGMAWGEHDSCIAAYEAHNAAVRAAVPASRLVEWQPGDGWGPLADALGVAAPDEPFPHANSTEEFRTNFGLGSA